MRESSTEDGDVLVWFSGHHRPFLVDESYCADPEHPCNEATLDFEEVCEGGAPLAEPMRFTLALDLDTWEEARPPERPPEARAFVEEFLRELPDEKKARLREDRQECLEVQRKLDTYTMPARDIGDGALLSYSEVLAEGDDPTGRAKHWFPVLFEEDLWFAEDLYCPNPACSCREASLMFRPCTLEDGKIHVLRDRFTVKLRFDGEATFDSLDGCTEADARAVLAELRRTCPGFLEVLRERYEAVKEIGKRSLRSGAKAPRPGERSASRDGQPPKRADGPSGGAGPRPAPPGTFVRQGPKVRPNDLCPCGSGKKYKKCCGR